MSKTRIVSLAAFFLLVAGGAAGSFWWALLQVPDFYSQVLNEAPDPVVRKAAAKQFVQQTLQLVDDIKQAETWSEEFQQQQINSWLAEELERKYSDLVPEGMSDLRVKLAEDVVLVGFRFEESGFRGVVSLRLKPWVSKPNQLAIEFNAIKAGLVPIPLDDVLQTVSEFLEEDGWRAEWSQANGNDVLMINLGQEEPDQPVLEAVKVVDGAIQVAGSRTVAAGSESSNNTSRVASQSAAE